jgi:hypothetical protein
MGLSVPIRLLSEPEALGSKHDDYKTTVAAIQRKAVAELKLGEKLQLLIRSVELVLKKMPKLKTRNRLSFPKAQQTVVMSVARMESGMVYCSDYWEDSMVVPTVAPLVVSKAVWKVSSQDADLEQP